MACSEDVWRLDGDDNHVLSLKDLLTERRFSSSFGFSSPDEASV